MAASESNNPSPNLHEHEVDLEKLLPSLPKQKDLLFTDFNLFHYKGFWFNPPYLRGSLNCQTHFKALESDVVLVTLPKSGTTWLKAILFTLLNRLRHRVDAPQHHPLTTHLPHALVPFLEVDLFRGIDQAVPDLSHLPSPRIFASHSPSIFLPSTIKESGSKIVYLCRDPRDTLISLWHFANKIRQREGGELVPLEEAVELFCRGATTCGPYWDHVLGYWKASIERPSEVFFFKYEDMKEDPALWVKRLAEFLGCPFSSEEVEDGVVEKIVEMCSFDHLSNLEVNKNGNFYHSFGIENKAFFRRGEVGDWANYLTPEMAEKMEKIGEEKFSGSGLKLC